MGPGNTDGYLAEKKWGIYIERDRRTRGKRETGEGRQERADKKRERRGETGEGAGYSSYYKHCVGTEGMKACCLRNCAQSI